MVILMFLMLLTTVTGQEPLPQPHLDILCQSFGERRVRCAPAGQQYTWTLNSTVINSTDAYMSDPSDVIILKGHMTGNLTCVISMGSGEQFTTAWLPVCEQSDYSKQVCDDREKKPDQLCVNSRIVLLGCGTLAVLVTLILALCCLRIALDTKLKSLPEDQPIYTEIDFETQEENKARSGIQDMAVMYAKVRKGSNDRQPEGQRDTSNLDFCMYGHD
ncbi:uncharacterized protein LOC108440626 [Pygocentrus nattereri]|uniref:uncharacterized protein LOC108440626 n=1 Tax=Pygocentrus nattereri TaxID=42514 RepID=UPI00081431D8|nr:uncharacterized protein LOC108440626 [Pygocentrus nattereri]